MLTEVLILLRLMVKKGTVTFDGTDFGDDGQLDIEGDERIDE